MGVEPPEERSAVDIRLDQHMELLRADDGPAGSRALSHRIARTARWQAALRIPLRAAASLFGAAAHGLSVLTGIRKRGTR